MMPFGSNFYCLKGTTRAIVSDHKSRKAFALMLVLFCLTIVSFSLASNSISHCSNGRQALWTFEKSIDDFSPNCPSPGQPCRNRTGKCSEDYLCCPRILKMSSKSRLVDRATGIVFRRVAEDFRDAYRLFELQLTSNERIFFDHHARWLFFDEILRDLFEMPRARFWFPMINCLNNHGIAYALVPLNASSITSNISAMTIVTRRTYAFDSLYICYMVTHKEHRRRGLATRLLQQIVQRALTDRHSGIQSIVMHVNTLNTVALELYERCGWRCYEYLLENLDPDPHHQTNHAFGLILYLDAIRNVTALCRDPSAVVNNRYNDEQSISKCRRTPVSF